ncbi:hypothetical protein ACYOEI_36345, partial [Singulisphaera rosea]
MVTLVPRPSAPILKPADSYVRAETPLADGSGRRRRRAIRVVRAGTKIDRGLGHDRVHMPGMRQIVPGRGGYGRAS